MTSQAFEPHRAALLGLAYRMLGDMGRAEDVVQDGLGHPCRLKVRLHTLPCVVAQLVGR